MSEAPETVADTEAPEGVAEGVEEVSVEDQARKRGWRPKDEFDGPEDRWIDAETFVKRGEEEPALTRKELQAANRKIASLERDLKQFAAYHTKAEERAYKRALTEIQDRLDQAAANGDVEGVRVASDELVELRTEAANPVKPDDDEPDWFTDWKADNDWFGKDKARSASAAAFAEELMAEGYSGKALAKEVDRKLKEEFPHKYAKATNPNRAQPSAVEGSGTAVRKAGKTRSDLPADARATMDRWVKQGLVTEAEYIKEYFA